MTTKYIEDIRKIAKTYEILKKIPIIGPLDDKPAIGSSRGVGLADATTVYSPCQLLYGAQDGSYTFASLVDGAPGTPRIQDTAESPVNGSTVYNQCSTLNTITGMCETATCPTSIANPNVLHMVLKPDGQFTNTPGTLMYTSEYLINDYLSLGNFAGFNSPSTLTTLYPDPNAFLYPTPQACAAAVLARWITVDTLFTTHTLVPLTLIDPTLVAAVIGSYNFASTSAVYSFGIERAGYTGGGSVTDPQYYMDMCFAVPVDYNYTTPAPSGPYFGTTVPAIQYPRGREISTTPNATLSGLMGVFAIPAFQLAIDTADTRQWKPNPAEKTAPVKYSQGTSIIQMSFGTSFARTGVVRPAVNGGFMLYETSTGTPINNAYVYRQDRTLMAIVPVAQLASYTV